MEMDMSFPVALGAKRSAPLNEDRTHTCILCQADEELEAEGNALVMAAYVQTSTVLSRRRPKADEDASVSGAGSSRGSSPDKDNSCPLLKSDLSRSPYASSCGHTMHASCWQKHYDDILQHERLRNRLRHPQSFDVSKQEFLCPLCRCISNTVMPLIPQFHLLQPSSVQKTSPAIDLSFSDWVQALLIALKYRRELKEVVRQDTITDDVDEEEGEDAPESEGGATGGGASSSSISSAAAAATIVGKKRFYTCPLDQVMAEMEAAHHDSKSFARLFTDHEGSELQFSTSVFEMMNLFSQAVFGVGLDSVAGEQSADEPLPHHDERIPLMTWQTCAFTIHSVVWSILDQGKSIFGGNMSSRHTDCLSALVRFCGVVGSNFGEPKVIRSHSLKLLSTLFEVDTANLSVLEFDAFGMLVACTFSLPSLFNEHQAAPLPSGNVQDKHILHLLFVVHLVQILLTTDQFTCRKNKKETSAEEEEYSKAEHLPVLDLLQLVREAVGFASDVDGSEGLDTALVWEDLKAASLPFLRCAALFYHFLTSVPGPQNLKHFESDEFDLLTQYLGLPSSPRKLLESPHLIGLARKWSNHPNVHIMLSPAASQTGYPVNYPHKVNTLIDLPQDYSELINAVSNFSCPKSLTDDTRVPAMCLICGAVLCSQSYCCQTTLDGTNPVGACTYHADKCGAGTGIFLRVRECKLVLLAGRGVVKGCFYVPPYVDQYGETDSGLRRGNPLTLCPELLDKLRKMWLNHGVAEEIAHRMESSHMFMATPWNNL
jgi:E3 ubiquitin-protein ligase UBR2